ncbi:MAG: cyclase family protein [Thermodesulfobacteriota bacterium]
MDPAKIRGLLKTGRVFDLGMDYYVGMPHHPVHPPFAFSLIKLHGDLVYDRGVSSSNCMFTTGGHTGTHMDALGHFSHEGRVHGVERIDEHQDHHGLRKAGIDQAAPVVTRGVLLDIAGLEGVDCLDHGYRIGVDALQRAAQRQGVAIEPGDAVLLRTGWIRYFGEPRLYIAHEKGCPGLVEDGARWLVERGVAHVGADTVALEKTPTPNYPVHIILLVENGVHILEALNLEELAAAKAYEFLFMVSPLKIRGGTASPVRPVAVA